MSHARWLVWLPAAAVMCAACGSTIRHAEGLSTKPSGSQSPHSAPTQPGTAECEPADIQLTYRGGGWGGGSDFGVLIITNSSEHDCRFTSGHLTVNPLDAAGHVIDTYAGWVNRVSLADLMLTGHGLAPASGVDTPPAERWVEVILGGDERDGPGTASLCRANAEVTPAAWQITGVVSVTVMNTDVTRLGHPAPQTPAHLYACGQPALHMLNVDIVQQP